MTGYRPICDAWILGRPKGKGPDGKTYYGGYPGGFLHRARELLGVHITDSVLHVCSGAVKSYPFRGFGPNDFTVDLDPALEPDFCQDVRDPLPKFPRAPEKGWPALLADPPYTESDADHYTVGRGVFPTPRKLLLSMLEAVRPGGRVGILHYKVPRPPSSLLVPDGTGTMRETKIRFVAMVGVFCGFDGSIRAYSVFEKEAIF